MRKFIWLVLAVSFLGCSMTSVYEKTASQNKINLENLSVGMNKDEVLKVMGTQTSKGGYWDGHATIKNPYKTEKVEGKSGTLEAVSYFTDPIADRENWSDADVEEEELTVLFFKDGKLAGWGQDFEKENIANYEVWKYRRFFKD